jgi:hypothetical protein
VTRFGYLSDEVPYRVKIANLDMEKLYLGETEDARRALGPLGMDELNKFLGYVPRLELEVNIMPITRAIL